MEVKTSEIDQAMDGIYQGSIATNEVEQLLNEMRSEQGMAVGGDMVGAGNNAIGQGNPNQIADPSKDMEERLKNLWLKQ